MIASTWRRLSVVTALLIGIGGCASLQQLAALRRVEFAIDGVGNGRLAGIDLSRVSFYRNLTATDLGRVTLALARKDLPLEFQVNVQATNPSANAVTATMARLAWSLFLDERETITGVVDTPVSLPPGQPVIIPVPVRLNLVEFFDGSAQDLVNLALAIAGLDSNPTRVSLRAVPTVSTRLGPITYPGSITIVSRTVGGTR